MNWTELTFCPFNLSPGGSETQTNARGKKYKKRSLNLEIVCHKNVLTLL